jgi:hypothetical protein
MAFDKMVDGYENAYCFRFAGENGHP